MRLIDADALIRAIVDTPTETSGYNPVYLCGSATRQNEIIDIIQELPTVDPVVHGQWVFRNDGRYKQTRCYCTVCGKHSGIGGIKKNQLKPYCPNCGEKMDLEED